MGGVSCDCIFWDDRGGGLTGQPMGPQADTVVMCSSLLSCIKKPYLDLEKILSSG